MPKNYSKSKKNKAKAAEKKSEEKKSPAKDLRNPLNGGGAGEHAPALAAAAPSPAGEKKAALAAPVTQDTSEFAPVKKAFSALHEFVTSDRLLLAAQEKAYEKIVEQWAKQAIELHNTFSKKTETLLKHLNEDKLNCAITLEALDDQSPLSSDGHTYKKDTFLACINQAVQTRNAEQKKLDAKRISKEEFDRAYPTPLSLASPFGGHFENEQAALVFNHWVGQIRQVFAHQAQAEKQYKLEWEKEVRFILLRQSTAVKLKLDLIKSNFKKRIKNLARQEKGEEKKSAPSASRFSLFPVAPSVLIDEEKQKQANIIFRESVRDIEKVFFDFDIIDLAIIEFRYFISFARNLNDLAFNHPRTDLQGDTHEKECLGEEKNSRENRLAADVSPLIRDFFEKEMGLKYEKQENHFSGNILLSIRQYIERNFVMNYAPDNTVKDMLINKMVSVIGQLENDCETTHKQYRLHRARQALNNLTKEANKDLKERTRAICQTSQDQLTLVSINNPQYRRVLATIPLPAASQFNNELQIAIPYCLESGELIIYNCSPQYKQRNIIPVAKNQYLTETYSLKGPGFAITMAYYLPDDEIGLYFYANSTLLPCSFMLFINTDRIKKGINREGAWIIETEHQDVNYSFFIKAMKSSLSRQRHVKLLGDERCRGTLLIAGIENYELTPSGRVMITSCVTGVAGTDKRLPLNPAGPDLELTQALQRWCESDAKIAPPACRR